MGGELSEVVAWLRRQSDLGANMANAADKGTTKRSAFGGGSLALAKAADAIESGEYRTNDNTANTRTTPTAPQVDAGELREKVARIIDPIAFKGFQSMLDHCECVGEVEETALRYAATTYGPELEAARTKADAILKLLPSPIEGRREVDDDEETYQIGLCDGYEKAVQEIDQLTGGDGEYRYCTDHDPERHTPDAPAMIQRIVDRFAALSLPPKSPDLATRAATLESELERVRDEMVVLAEAEARGLV